MESPTYFYPQYGQLVFSKDIDPKLRNKIDNLCQISVDQTELIKEGKQVEYFPQHHGYIVDNTCYSNEAYLYKKSWEKYNKIKKAEDDKLQKYIDDTNKCISILENLFKRIKDYRSCKNKIISLTEKFEKGYVKNETVLRGSKRGRRFQKGASVRYLTEKEMKNIEKQIEELKKEIPKLKQNINSKVSFDSAMKIIKDINNYKLYASELNYKFDRYGDTKFLFKILEELFYKVEPDKLN